MKLALTAFLVLIQFIYLPFQKDVFLTKYDVFYAVTDFPHHLYIKMINLLSCTSCAIVL